MADIGKFRDIFGPMAVYKDLKNTNFFSALGLPSFLRDWLLQKYQDQVGKFDAQAISDFTTTYLPSQEGWLAIKDRLINDFEKVKILAKITADIDIATGAISFSLPDYGLGNNLTVIDPQVWDNYKDNLVSGKETWGLLELSYRPPDESARPKLPGRILLNSFRNFCPYEIDLEYFRQARAEFSFDEWLDILLGAVDYNPDGYESARKENTALPETGLMKRTFISRLLPFVEKRLNLMELAPKGTGKSYIFGQISRYGWLSTSNRLTRAKLFYDLARRSHGLVAQNDFLALDEIQKTYFEDGMGVILQGYMENGAFTVGNFSGSAHCGMMLCGNIAPDLMEADGDRYMFENLPRLFHDPALIDRFHGFIKGWRLPRMNDDLKINGWALNSEYFTAILHDLRSEGGFRAIVDEIIDVPKGADTRDTEAVKRCATGFLKLFFPHIHSPEDIKTWEFENYCLRPALNMRLVIKKQLSMMDKQYKPSVPQLKPRK